MPFRYCKCANWRSWWNTTVELEFYYEESDNQEDKFSLDHVRYDCYITRDDIKVSFEYQCNPKYFTPTLYDVMESLIFDSSIDNIDELHELMPDSKVSKIIKTFNLIQENNYKLHKILSDEEIEKLNYSLCEGLETIIREI